MYGRIQGIDPCRTERAHDPGQSRPEFSGRLAWISIKTIDLVGGEPEWDLFRFFYRYSPYLMRIPFVLTRNPRGLHAVNEMNIRRLEEKLVAILHPQPEKRWSAHLDGPVCSHELPGGEIMPVVIQRARQLLQEHITALAAMQN